MANVTADNYPSIADLAELVYQYGRDLAQYDPADITEYGCDEPSGDCRLQVQSDGWSFHTGDSQYDQDHRGYWGASSVSPKCTRKEARVIARDLIEQAKDHAAECGDDPDDDEPLEPSEGDYILSPTGYLGGKTAVSQCAGKHLGNFAEESEARAFIREHMDREQFWPNVWTLSDHGNYHLTTLD